MKKFCIALIGGTVLLIGAAMLVLPGPGMLVIAGGLAILATEFFRARRALRSARGAVARVRRSRAARLAAPRQSALSKKRPCAELGRERPEV
jgi:hypothetical protein